MKIISKNISKIISKNIIKIKKDNILELLNNFIRFMKSNNDWTLLKMSNDTLDTLKKEFIENLNEVLDKKEKRVGTSLMFYKGSSDRLRRTVSIKFFIDKETMKGKLNYEYTFLNFRKPDDIHNFDGFIDFKRFFLEN